MVAICMIAKAAAWLPCFVTTWKGHVLLNCLVQIHAVTLRILHGADLHICSPVCLVQVNSVPVHLAKTSETSIGAQATIIELCASKAHYTPLNAGELCTQPPRGG